MKRLAYISLIALCLLEIVGFFPVFKIKQWEIRRDIEWVIKEKLSNNGGLKDVIIPKNYPLKWEREGSEFWFEGQLYDVVQSEIQDSVTHYYCINDVKETDLCAQFDKILQNSLKNDADTEGSSLSHFFKKMSEVALPNVLNLTPNDLTFGATKRLKTPIPFGCFYTSLSINSIDPPPKDLV